MGSGSEGNPAPPRAQDDLYRHVNAEWLAANPVPAEYGRWGTFEILNDDALIKTRTLLEELGPEDKAMAKIDVAARKRHERGVTGLPRGPRAHPRDREAAL